MRALAAPSSLKGVLPATTAAAALAEGFHAVGAVCDEKPVADGGEGTLAVVPRELVARSHRVQVPDAFAEPRVAEWLQLRDGTALVESAQAIPLVPDRLDARRASSRGLGELLAHVFESQPQALIVTLGGTANMDGGEGLLDVLDDLPVPTRVACDVRTLLADAPRLFGPQKGADEALVAELERRFAAHPQGHLPGSGAAGGLGAALASLGAELVPGARLVLELIAFDPRGYELVVSGEGTVDETTWEGKAPAVVREACEQAGVRCVLFGGRVRGGRAQRLSGDPARAYADLVTLGARLGGGPSTP